MSQELTKARQLLSGINMHLKQGKLLPAANSMYEAVSFITKNPLMKDERKEFHLLLDRAIYTLTTDPNLRKVYPLVIEYKPGKEKDLLEQIRQLLNELSTSKVEEVQAMLADRLKRKDEMLAKAQSLLDRGEGVQAKRIFDKVISEYGDTDLRADVADRFLRAECYPEAFDYLEEALQNDPKAIHLYNRIGIVLRKMKDYATAEKYYLRALEQTGEEDEYLYFNMGRLYIDWRMWTKVEDSANKALAVNPDFAEARKMLEFARKKKQVEDF